MDRNTTALFEALGEEGSAIFEHHRKEMRGSYLRAMADTVTLSNYDRLDDQFADLLDTQLATLFVRSGAIGHKEVFAGRAAALPADVLSLLTSDKSVDPAEREALKSALVRADGDLREAQHAATHFRNKLKALGLDPYDDTPVTADDLRKIANAKDKIEATKYENGAPDVSTLKKSEEPRGIPASNPGRMPQPQELPGDGLPKPIYEAPAIG